MFAVIARATGRARSVCLSPACVGAPRAQVASEKNGCELVWATLKSSSFNSFSGFSFALCSSPARAWFFPQPSFRRQTHVRRQRHSVTSKPERTFASRSLIRLLARLPVGVLTLSEDQFERTHRKLEGSICLACRTWSRAPSEALERLQQVSNFRMANSPTFASLRSR